MRLLFAALTGVIAGAPATALAASQILGLVATGEAVPMQCREGACTALLSAFCLQEERLPPDYGTAYAPAAPDAVMLVVTGRDGETRRLAAAGLVEFRSHYGFTAIRARLEPARLGAMAPVSVALEVAPRAAMLPVPVPGDADPLREDEIALATGPLRIAAGAVMEGGSEPARAARSTAGLINALPPRGPAPQGARDALRGRLAGAPPLAKATFEACLRSVDQSVGYRLRRCLEERHEKLQVRNTREYWQSLGGS